MKRPGIGPLLSLGLSLGIAFGSVPIQPVQAVKTGESWQIHIEKAYEALARENQDETIKELHQALRANSDPQVAMRIIREIVNVYKKLGKVVSARKIGFLILTPAYLPTDGSILRAHKIAIRKRALIEAGDQAASSSEDYLLADLLYSQLLPPPSLYDHVRFKSGQNDEYERLVVDRLVRLYLKHGDIERAELLINQSRTFEEQIVAAEGKSPNSKQHLASLGLNLALVRMHQKKYREAAKLFEKNTVQLERCMGKVEPQLATAYSDYGLALTRLKRYSQAESAYRRALKIARSNPGIKKRTLETIESNFNKLKKLKSE